LTFTAEELRQNQYDLGTRITEGKRRPTFRAVFFSTIFPLHIEL
jgi:hypothetical protein